MQVLAMCPGCLQRKHAPALTRRCFSSGVSLGIGEENDRAPGAVCTALTAGDGRTETVTGVDAAGVTAGRNGTRAGRFQRASSARRRNHAFCSSTARVLYSSRSAGKGYVEETLSTSARGSPFLKKMWRASSLRPDTIECFSNSMMNWSMFAKSPVILSVSRAA